MIVNMNPKLLKTCSETVPKNSLSPKARFVQHMFKIQGALRIFEIGENRDTIDKDYIFKLFAIDRSKPQQT